MYCKNFDELIERATGRSNDARKTVAVVAAEDVHALEAVLKAEKKGIIDSFLIGDSTKIEQILKEMGEVNKTIISANSPTEAAVLAVELIKKGAANFIMKGNIETKDLLKVVVNKEKGIGKGTLMSHIAIHELPWYHKLLLTTDGGMVMYPTLEEKKEIIQNAVDSLLLMGYIKPKVAVLTAVEKINSKMPETIEANELKEMCKKGLIRNAILEGPISFDLAVNKEKSKIKGYDSPVAGDADILIVPNIVAGNILGKSLLEFEGVKMAGLILGAQVPIVITSRGASEQEKYLSLLLASAMC